MSTLVKHVLIVVIFNAIFHISCGLLQRDYYNDDNDIDDNNGVNSNTLLLTDKSKNDIYDEVRQLLSLNGKLVPSHYHYKDTQYDRKEINHQKPPKPVQVQNWPEKPLVLGQVTGVTVNRARQPVIFHRVNRVFNEYTFNATNHFQQLHLGVIDAPTILTLSPEDGRILHGTGANLFYMPHGLTIDRYDNLWLTDVAMHQVFKLKAGDNQQQQPISVVYGERFIPGSDYKHLCMPTSVAVAETGEIFIADGYCNSRILQLNAAGGLLRIIPSPPDFLSLHVPHGLALIESLDRLCVADRENMRVTCPRAGLRQFPSGNKARWEHGEPPLTIQQPDMGRVFGIAAIGQTIYAVNGPTSHYLPVQGLTIDVLNETVIDHWAPQEGFGIPHAIATCPSGTALYVVEIGPNRVWKFHLQTSY